MNNTISFFQTNIGVYIKSSSPRPRSPEEEKEEAEEEKRGGGGGDP